MKGAFALPLYVDDRLHAFVRDSLSLQFHHTERFHPNLTPIQHAFMVMGRKGTDKRRALEHLLNNAKIPHATVSVEFGFTGQAMQDLMESIAELKARSSQSTAIEGAVILEHADVLCYEPDSEATMSFMLKLREMAHAERIFIITLWDRLPTDPSMPANLKRYTQEVTKQFQSMVYVCSPHSAYRQQLFEYCFKQFETFTNGQIDFSQLSENDYVYLADCSTYATQDQILTWIDGFLRELVPQATFQVTLDYIQSKLHARQNPGEFHISQYNLEDVESKFSETAGLGPVGAKKRNGVMLNPVERERNYKNVTGFTPENSDLESAKKKLKTK